MNHSAVSDLDCDAVNLAALHRYYSVSGRTVRFGVPDQSKTLAVFRVDEAWDRFAFIPRPLQLRRVLGALWIFHADLSTLIGPIDPQSVGVVVGDLCEYGVAQVDGPIRVYGQPMWPDAVLEVRPRSIECLERGYRRGESFTRYVGGHGAINRNQFETLSEMVQKLQQWTDWSLIANKGWHGAVDVAKQLIPGWTDRSEGLDLTDGGFVGKVTNDFDFAFDFDPDSPPLTHFAAYSVGRYLLDRLNISYGKIAVTTLIAVGSEFSADLLDSVPMDEALKQARQLVSCIVDTDQTQKAVARAFRYLEQHKTIVLKEWTGLNQIQLRPG